MIKKIKFLSMIVSSINSKFICTASLPPIHAIYSSQPFSQENHSLKKYFKLIILQDDFSVGEYQDILRNCEGYLQARSNGDLVDQEEQFKYLNDFGYEYMVKKYEEEYKLMLEQKKKVFDWNLSMR